MVSQPQPSKFVLDLNNIKDDLFQINNLLIFLRRDLAKLLAAQKPREQIQTRTSLANIGTTYALIKTRLHFTDGFDLTTRRGMDGVEIMARRRGIVLDVHQTRRLKRELMEMKRELEA